MTASDPRVRLDGITDAWLQQCGSCDAGLPMSCACPPSDPRSVIEKLARIVEAVLALHQPHDDGQQVTCTVCVTESGWHACPWPCPTVRAVAAHLDPGGDHVRTD